MIKSPTARTGGADRDPPLAQNASATIRETRMSMPLRLGF
jgi:hypothetical protein